MLESLLHSPAAVIAGLAGLVCLTIWPLFQTRTGILLIQLGATITFAFHYGLIGMAAPCLVNLLGSIQTGAAVFSAHNNLSNKIGYALIPLMVAVGIHFWAGPTSALCVAAMSLIALGRMQQSQLALRLMILGGNLFWIAHDYLVASLIALVADVASFTIGLIIFIRIILGQKSRGHEIRLISHASRI